MYDYNNTPTFWESLANGGFGALGAFILLLGFLYGIFLLVFPFMVISYLRGQLEVLHRIENKQSAIPHLTNDPD